MKKIEAIIQPYRMEDAKNALKCIGVDGMTISEVRGHGRQKGLAEMYRGTAYTLDLMPKIKIELIVADDLCDEAVETVARAAHTGKIGDGKLFVYDVVDAVRIRNGERGESAL